MSENPLIAGGTDVNPLKTDPELQSLLKRLDKVKKYKTFQRWKGKFLDRLEQFLYEKGMKPADKACNDYDALLKKFVKSATKVQDHIDKGELGDSKKTVKASLALNEMCNSLTGVVASVQDVIPMKSSEEKKRGYTKFHLGATLIRQGFHQYVSMKAIEDALTKIGEELVNVADRQQHDLFKEYSNAVQRFCDIMADLNLYEVMLKCLEFMNAPEEEESSDEEPVTIKITIDTHDGKKITLVLDPAETIGNVKAAIAEGCGIPADKQIMKFQGKDLDKDAMSLAACGVVDNSVLQVEPFRVPVTVNLMDGRKIKVMVDPSDRLSDIKIQLEDESGVPAKNQAIFMNGEELTDPNKTAGEYGIKAGSVLDLEPKVINITVNTPDGKKIKVQVKASDTAEAIKEKIANETGMKVPQQIIKFNGKEMPDGTTVRQMGIQDGSEIDVDIFKVPVTVNTMDGKSIQVMIDPTDRLSDIKVQLEDESGVPAKNQKISMGGTELTDPNKTAADYGIKAGSVLDLEPKIIKINVKTPDGKTISVQVDANDTAEAVKEKIGKQTGMTVPQQILKFQGKEFPNGKTVKDMGIQDGSDIDLEIFKVPVTVNTMDGKSIQVMIDPTDRLSDIKVQLEDESGVPAKNQKISMGGKELSDPNKTAADYGIKAGSVLDLEPKIIKISVKTPDGGTISVEVGAGDTAEAVKEKIGKQTGMTVPQQLLKFQGKEFPNGKTVKDMGIQDGSELTVDIFRVPVTVNTMDGKSIKVMVDPTDKLSAIKKQLEDESGVPAKNQKILMGGKELADDNKTAGDYGIKSGSVLDLEPKIITLNVKTPDGKTISVQVDAGDSGEAVKEKIAKQTGMTVPQQVLKFKGKEFPNAKTVRDMGIQDGSDIDVEIFKVPVTVNCMDGTTIKAMIDPTAKISEIKTQLEDESGVPASNMKLFMNGDELADANKSAGSYGVKKGSVLDLEPKTIKVNVELPDGTKHTVDVKPSDSSDDIKAKIAKASGMEAPRQLLKVGGKEMPKGTTAREMGLKEGSDIKVEIFTLPIKVKTPDGETISLNVEPSDSIDKIKKMIHKEIGMDPKKQILKFNAEEVKGGRSARDCGIKAGSELVLEEQDDPIIFVDIKCGTLFAMDRDLVIKAGALTPHQNNKLDFIEAAKDSTNKDKIRDAMKGSPTLGVSPQVVVTGLTVENYDLEEAEKVKGVFGVSLKKRERNKKGEEFLFVDPKTGQCGELTRKKYIDMGFITPETSGKTETLKEREKDNMVYDKYIEKIRSVFGIKSAK